MRVERLVIWKQEQWRWTGDPNGFVRMVDHHVGYDMVGFNGDWSRFVGQSNRRLRRRKKTQRGRARDRQISATSLADHGRANQHCGYRRQEVAHRAHLVRKLLQVIRFRVFFRRSTKLQHPTLMKPASKPILILYRYRHTTAELNLPWLPRKIPVHRRLTGSRILPMTLGWP